MSTSSVPFLCAGMLCVNLVDTSLILFHFFQCALFTPSLYLVLQRVDLVIHFPYRWRRVPFYITLNIPDSRAGHTFAVLYLQFAVYFRCMDVLCALLAGAGRCAV